MQLYHNLVKGTDLGISGDDRCSFPYEVRMCQIDKSFLPLLVSIFKLIYQGLKGELMDHFDLLECKYMYLISVFVNCFLLYLNELLYNDTSIYYIVCTDNMCLNKKTYKPMVYILNFVFAQKT